jgi:ACT domain-containing protein
MRAIVTVIGTDRVGIIAGISTVLADANVNILDITQTTMQGIFTMIMLVNTKDASVAFEELDKRLKARGESLGLQVRIQREDIFNSMHRV